MNRDRIPRFERLLAQIRRLHVELAKLSATEPAGALSAFKKGVVESVLTDAQAFLEPEYRPFDALHPLDETSASNSDATLVVAQYVECFERLRADNATLRHGKWCWMVDGPSGPEYVPIVHPKTLFAGDE